MRIGKLIRMAACCMLPVSLCAQQGPDTTIQTSISLDEVVISATRSPEQKSTVSQHIEVMQAKQIAQLQVQTTADLIATSGSVAVQKSQAGGGSPVIRGFEANRILLVIDGVRLNNLIYRGGHLQNILSLDHAILDRAEILFGPSSTTYGSDALGGVIHLYTRDPLLSQEKLTSVVNAYTRYSSANHEKTAHLDVSLGTRKFGSLTSFTFSDFDHLRSGARKNPFYKNDYGDRPYYAGHFNGSDSLVANEDPSLQIQSGYSQMDLLQKLVYQPAAGTRHRINLQYSTTSDVPRYDRLTNPDSAGLEYAEWYYGPQLRSLMAWDLEIKRPGNGFQTLYAGINYQHVRESRHTRRFNSAELSNRTEKVNVLGGFADLIRIVNSHKIHVGIDAQYNRLESTAFLKDTGNGAKSPLDTRYPDGGNNMTHLAVYISHTWQLNPALILNDGLRLGYSSLRSAFSDTTFFKFPFSKARQDHPVYSGSVGLVYHPKDNIKLSCLVATGFRVPNVDDLGKVFESAPGTIIVPNPDLEPETTIGTEIGLEFALNKRLRWHGTAYYTILRDAIATAPFAYNGFDSLLYDGVLSRVIANQNNQEATISGFSSSLKAQVMKRLVMDVSASFVYGRLNTGSGYVPLDHISPFMMRLNADYTWNKFGARLFVVYNGWKRIEDYHPGGEDNAQYATPDGMPAWLRLNAHFMYKLTRYLSLRTGVENIMDTRYRVFASGINAPGRNMFVTLAFSQYP